jgi:hypothetical protein
MPRENSLDESDTRSLTPDIGEEEEGVVAAAGSPIYSSFPEAKDVPQPLDLARVKSAQSKKSLHSRFSMAHPSGNAIPMTSPGRPKLAPKERFRAAARKVLALHRGTTTMLGAGKVGAEPGVDPSRPAVDAAYRHIHQECEIEIMDYSAVRSTSRKMNNNEFVQFMNMGSSDPPPREPWVKVRWINIGGVSWDVIKALAVKYRSSFPCCSRFIHSINDI